MMQPIRLDPSMRSEELGPDHCIVLRYGHCVLAAIHSSYHATRVGLMQMLGPPGATTALNCSLCRAGAYATGSGQGLGFGIEQTNWSIMKQTFCCVMFLLTYQVDGDTAHHPPRSEASDWACRRNHSFCLQSMSGWDILDRIR